LLRGRERSVRDGFTVRTGAAIPERMSSPSQPDAPPPTYIAVERPRRSPLLLVWVLGVGTLLGASCVTCANASMELNRDQVYGAGPEKVGVIELEGAIMEAEEVVRSIRRFGRRDDLEALVIRINSPGGTVAPSQEIFDAMRTAAKDKPVVASMGTVAASGGFWVAMGADWVIAEPGTITGSIGVITQSPDLRQLADKVGVDVRVFKSGAVKDLGNPLRELTAEDEAVFQGLIDDIYEQFVEVISERRSLPTDQVRAVADGRIFSGRRARELGLIDELGGLHAAARRGVVLAQQRRGELEAGTSTSTADRPDPALVYPRSPTPEILEVLTQTAAQAFARGWAEAWGLGSAGAPILLR